MTTETTSFLQLTRLVLSRSTNRHVIYTYIPGLNTHQSFICIILVIFMISNEGEFSIIQCDRYILYMIYMQFLNQQQFCLTLTGDRIENRFDLNVNLLENINISRLSRALWLEGKLEFDFVKDSSFGIFR